MLLNLKIFLILNKKSDILNSKDLDSSKKYEELNS